MPHVNRKTIPSIANLVEKKTRPGMNYEWIGKTS